MIAFTFPEQIELSKAIGFVPGEWDWRYFPDGESYVRVLSSVKGQAATIVCSLNQPDQKTLPLIFLARTLKEMGATRITLFSPYLGYMRQDKSFTSGEAVTSGIFAKLISPHIDALITIDPHLHRHHRLQEIYSCECIVITAASLIIEWIKKNVEQALLIGPDIESEQWVRSVAAGVKAPYIILKKIRRGDHDVEVSLPDIKPYRSHTPVLLDDIISTAATMIKTVELLRQKGLKDIICVATHGLFAGNAYAMLQKTGVARIVTSNTVPHLSNALQVAPLLASFT